MTIKQILLGALLATLFAGCIADTPEDSSLPWASRKSWEGVAPVSGLMDRYD